MIYRQKNKSKFKGLKIIGFIFLVFLVFRLFAFSFVLEIFNRPLNYILESNNYILGPIKHTFIYFKDKKDLQEQVQKLQSENVDLKLDNLLNKNITQEFEYFKNQFGDIVEENSIYKVILRPPFTPFDTIQISGNFDNRNIGDLVSYKNILIGKIVEKNSRYATVELFSSPDKSIPIIVNGTQFEAKGLGGGRYVFEASKESVLTEGEPITYPEQYVLILGIIEFIETKEEDLFKKVYFNLPVALDSISYVTVGTIQPVITQEE